MEVLNFQIKKLVDYLNKMGFIILLLEVVQRPVMRKGLFNNETKTLEILSYTQKVSLC